ncbi:MFS transporter [Polaromonas sp.]|uniref:MFS transporter n=1 Tax=Polaromonas sp. TaxID=1869339 RepID=UPI001DC8BFEB|nr:MFS transporter [Polaromonas sp.]MBT9475203.1 MFS transporter [Polaromonas sp.]
MAERIPGEFQRGWRILLLALAGAATTVSVTLLYSFGTLVLPLERAFGWSRGDLQIAIACMSGGVVVASQLAGWLNLRWGMRRMTLLSLLALPLAFLAITFMGQSIFWLYLGYFLIPIAGVGVTFVTWTQLVSSWFDRKRGLALALVLCGSGIAAAVLPPLLTWAMERWDWRAAYVVMGLLPLLLTLPLALRFLVPSPAAVSNPAIAVRKPAVASASFRVSARSGKFWILNIALTLVVSAVVGMVTNTVPLLRDIGLSATQASSVFSSFGIALISGRLLAGWLIDRLWAPGVAAVALFMPCIGCLLLWTADASSSTLLLTAAVALVGIGAGAEFDLSAYLISRYFGLKDYGRLFGIHLGLITAGSMLAPLMFAAMYKTTGGYGPLLAWCAGCCVVGPLLLLTLGRQPPLESAVTQAVGHPA